MCQCCCRYTGPLCGTCDTNHHPEGALQSTSYSLVQDRCQQCAKSWVIVIITVVWFLGYFVWMFGAATAQLHVSLNEMKHVSTASTPADHCSTAAAPQEVCQADATGQDGQGSCRPAAAGMQAAWQRLSSMVKVCLATLPLVAAQA